MHTYSCVFIYWFTIKYEMMNKNPNKINYKTFLNKLKE